MRLGGPISLIVHLALAWGGITVIPTMVSEPEPIPVFNIDLVTIAEETNLKAAPAELEETEPEEVPPPAPEPEEVPIPEEAAPPPPKPEPPKPKEADFQSELDKILNEARKAEPAPAKKEPPNPFNNPNRQRLSVGTGDGETVRIEQYIMRQLLDNECWSDQETLANSQNMVATIRVRFGHDGHFSEDPQLIVPARMPAQGPFLVYITRAFAGLSRCNNIGFKVPETYFTTMKSPYINLNFKP